MFKNFNPFQSGFRNAQGCRVEAELCVKMHPLGAAGRTTCAERALAIWTMSRPPTRWPRRASAVWPAQAISPYPRCKGRRLHRLGRQGPDQCLAPAALGAELRVKIIPPGRPVREQIFRHRARKPDLPQRSGCPRGLSAPRVWAGRGGCFPRRKAEDGVATRLLPAHRGRALGSMTALGTEIQKTGQLLGVCLPRPCGHRCPAPASAPQKSGPAGLCPAAPPAAGWPRSRVPGRRCKKR